MTHNDFAISFRWSECRLSDFIDDASKRFSRDQIRAVLIELETAGRIQIEDPSGIGLIIVRLIDVVGRCKNVADVVR